MKRFISLVSAFALILMLAVPSMSYAASSERLDADNGGASITISISAKMDGLKGSASVSLHAGKTYSSTAVANAWGSFRVEGPGGTEIARGPSFSLKADGSDKPTDTTPTWNFDASNWPSGVYKVIAEGRGGGWNSYDYVIDTTIMVDKSSAGAGLTPDQEKQLKEAWQNSVTTKASTDLIKQVSNSVLNEIMGNTNGGKSLSAVYNNTEANNKLIGVVNGKIGETPKDQTLVSMIDRMDKDVNGIKSVQSLNKYTVTTDDSIKLLVEKMSNVELKAVAGKIPATKIKVDNDVITIDLKGIKKTEIPDFILVNAYVGNVIVSSKNILRKDFYFENLDLN